MSLISPRVKVKRSRLQDSLNTSQTTLITQDDAGNYGHARADAFGSLRVKGGDESIFGSVKNMPITTIIQNSAPYGLLNDQVFNIYTSGG